MTTISAGAQPANPVVSAAWPEPHMDWLNAYQATRAHIDNATDEETPELQAATGRMMPLERLILSEPAYSQEAVLAKLFVLAKVNADGALPDDGVAACIIAEAEQAFGLAAKVLA